MLTTCLVNLTAIILRNLRLISYVLLRSQMPVFSQSTCLFIKSWFVEPYNKTGCRYLVVDAYNEDVPMAFYKKNGFDFMFSTEEQEKSYRGIVSDKPLKTRLMYFDLILIK